MAFAAAAATTTTTATKPKALSQTPKQVSVELVDVMDPIAWNIDPCPEDLALLNIVELEQDEVARGEGGVVTSSEQKEKETTSHRKRGRGEGEEEEDVKGRKTPEEEAQQDHQGKILSAVSHDAQDHHHHHHLYDDTPEEFSIITVEKSPRVSRRRKKKLKRSISLPKRPLGAYGVFYHQERQKIVESLTEGVSLSEDDIQRQVGKLWRALPQDEIKKFEQLAEQERARYHEEMEEAQKPINSSSTTPTTNAEEKHMPKLDPKTTGMEEEEDEEGVDECGYFPYDLPPPPPGVTVIPISGSGSDAGSVAAVAATVPVVGMKVATPTSSPVPPPPTTMSPGGVWGYHRHPPPPVPVHHRPAYASPVPSNSTSAGPHVVQASPYPPPRREYYPPPSPRSWVTSTPPSPYHHVHHVHHGQLPPPPPSLANYSPDFAHAARPAATYHYGPPFHRPTPRAPNFSIPPGMELALPDGHGREKKYRVTYKCFRMKAEDVQGFLDSMAVQRNPPPPPHQQQLPPPSPHHHYHLPPNAVTQPLPPRPRQVVPYHHGQCW